MYRIGSVIEYRTFTGMARTVLVKEKESDIKNGRAGFAAYQKLGMITVGVWGYDDQITKVIKY